MLRNWTIGALAFLVILLSGVSTAIAADVTLRYAGTLPATHHNGEGQYMLAKRVLELTNGSVEIEVYPAGQLYNCLLYTSPSPRDGLLSRMPSSA